MDKKIKVVGNIADNGKFESTARIYGQKNICPTLNTCGGGDRQPKVIRRWKENAKW